MGLVRLSTYHGYSKNLDEFSILFPPPTHVTCEMTKPQNLYVEKYEIVEVGCTVKVTLREDKQEKRKRELNKFGTTLKPNMDQYPEKLGRLFER